MHRVVYDMVPCSHASFNSFNNGCMYTSNTLPFTIVGSSNNTNGSTNNCLVVIHGGKLYPNANASHVLHLHNFVVKGLKPPTDKPMTMSIALCPNSPIVVVKCFHAIDYTKSFTKPIVFLCMACHFNNAAIFGDMNHLTRSGIRGKYRITFTCTNVLPYLLYWPSLHFEQMDAFSCTPLYNTHPLPHVYMLLQVCPTFLMYVFAWYMLLGKQLLLGSMKLWSNENNSSTN